MSKIPCKKCPGCGLYHGISIVTCDECGRELKNISAHLVETDEIPGEQFGDIDKDAIAYVQKCSACGALNFSSSAEEPIRICYNCHKTRIASIKPVKYTVEEVADDKTDEIAGNDTNRADNAHKENINQDDRLFNNGEDDDEDDDDSAQWQGILGNIRQAVGSETLKKTAVKNETPSIAADSIFGDSGGADDDDDDDDDADWGEILGGKSKPKKAVTIEAPKEITLTAIRYGRLSFTIEAGDNRPYMLGRSANQSKFLVNDGRVGNEHCYIFFKDGFWYVRDNHSANGTAVNSRDIGLDGEHILNDGDELKLGHHPDSMAFRITI